MGRHVVFVRIMALRIVRSFRMHAVSATFLAENRREAAERLVREIHQNLCRVNSPPSEIHHFI